jgi:putative Holliday junction resolvase
MGTSEDKGKVMALDLGEKRIGVAVSDELRMIARSHSVLRRKSRREDYERYARIIEEERICLLVVGLPVTLSGDEGEKAAWVRDYTTELGRFIRTPIVYWDESLTTVDALSSLRDRGVGRKRVGQKLDAVAAAFILQSYLDANR